MSKCQASSCKKNKNVPKCPNPIEESKVEPDELLKNVYPNDNETGDGEDFTISRHEMEQLKDAFKKEEFRKMLSDYVKDVRDPANQLTFQTELRLLEKQRGNTVHFINPVAGYVLKTSINGQKKCFVNICSNSLIKKPTCEIATLENKTGQLWSIPHSPSQAREDIDKSRNGCLVYDVIFNPEALRLAKNSSAFKEKIEETAMEAIESNFSVKLDKNNLRRPKLKYKGLKHPTMIKYKTGDEPPEILDAEEISKETPPQNDNDVVSPRKSKNKKAGKNKTSSSDSPAQNKCKENTNPADLNNSFPGNSSNPKSATEVVLEEEPATGTGSNANASKELTEPHYTLKFRNHVNIQDFCLDTQRDGRNVKPIPEEVILIVDLPLLRDSSNLEADVFEDGWNFELKSENKVSYKLNMKLPFQVQINTSKATFDKDKRKLEIVMRTVQKPREPIFVPSEPKPIVRHDAKNYHGGTEAESGDHGFSESLDSYDDKEEQGKRDHRHDSGDKTDDDSVFTNHTTNLRSCFKSGSVESSSGILSRSSSTVDYDTEDSNSPSAPTQYGSPCTKKTVRFNDSVQKQLYRSNSSILGQKKKNQRKAKSKNKRKERERTNSGGSISSLSVDDEQDLEDEETDEGFVLIGGKPRERFNSGGSISSIDEELLVSGPIEINDIGHQCEEDEVEVQVKKPSEVK